MMSNCLEISNSGCLVVQEHYLFIVDWEIHLKNGFEGDSSSF